MKLLLCLSLLLGVAACSAADPTQRSGTWQPIGANDANLRAMIADPADLSHGRAGTDADGQVAANAVARYRAGKVKQLPDSGAAQMTSVSFGNSNASPASSGPN